MNMKWHIIKNKKPPERIVTLVYGPLGVDLGIYISGHWYFKRGDDWSAENLELWHFNAPQQWAEIELPGEYGKSDPLSVCQADESCGFSEDANFELMMSAMDTAAANLKN